MDRSLCALACDLLCGLFRRLERCCSLGNSQKLKPYCMGDLQATPILVEDENDAALDDD
jgi:hypothetical protein